MPFDMPPQRPAVEYVVRVPAPSADSSLSSIVRAVKASGAAASAKASEWTSPGGSAANRMLPPIDYSSPALTRADRLATIDAIEARGRDGLSGVGIRPDAAGGYPASRIALARDLASLGSEPSAARVHSYRCRLVAVALDARAGAYVVGGERAASSARSSVPADMLRECRPGLMGQAQRVVATRNAAPVRVDPSIAVGVASSTDPVAGRTTSQSVDPSVVRSRPSRVDPAVRRAPSVRIDPEAHTKPPVRIDLGARTKPSVAIVSIAKGPSARGHDDLGVVAAARLRNGGRAG